MQLVNALDNDKSVFVKKARGLGITELILMYMVYLAVKMMIITDHISI
jgi:hypothetical protein